MQYWHLIEADFQREYTIDLRCIDMSYHRFMSLLSGLSGDSRFFYAINEREKQEKEKPIAGATNIAANMAAMISKKKRR